MKQFAIVMLVGMLFSAAAVYADNPTDDYGYNVISSDFDPDIYKPEGERPHPFANHYSEEWADFFGYEDAAYFATDTVWSNDGEWIAFVTGGQTRSLFVVPASGGEPVLVRHGMQEYGDYMLTNGITFLHCFSPDSSEIVLTEQVIDEEMGTEIEIRDGGSSFGYSTNGAIPALKAIDIETGEERIIAYNSWEAQYSMDGRYFAYAVSEFENDDLNHYIVVENLNTGETHNRRTHIRSPLHSRRRIHSLPIG